MNFYISFYLYKTAETQRYSNDSVITTICWPALSQSFVIVCHIILGSITLKLRNMIVN